MVLEPNSIDELLEEAQYARETQTSTLGLIFAGLFLLAGLVGGIWCVIWVVKSLFGLSKEKKGKKGKGTVGAPIVPINKVSIVAKLPEASPSAAEKRREQAKAVAKDVEMQEEEPEHIKTLEILESAVHATGSAMTKSKSKGKGDEGILSFHRDLEAKHQEIECIQCKDEVKVLKSRIESLEKEAEKQDCHQEGMAKYIEGLKTESDVLRDNLNAREEENGKLRLVQTEIKTLRSCCQTYKERLMWKTQELKRLEIEKGNLRAIEAGKQNSSETDVSDLRSQLEVQKEELKSKSKEIDNLRTEKTKLEQDLDSAAQQLDSLSQGNADLVEHTKKRLEQELQNVRLQIESLNEKNRKLADQKIAGLEQQLEDSAQASKIEGNELRSQLATLAEQNVRLKQELETTKLQSIAPGDERQPPVSPVHSHNEQLTRELSRARRRHGKEKEFLETEAKFAQDRAVKFSDKEKKLENENAELTKNFDAAVAEKLLMKDEYEMKLKEATMKRPDSVTNGSSSGKPAIPFEDKRPGMSSLPRPKASRSPIPIEIIHRKK